MLNSLVRSLQVTIPESGFLFYRPPARLFTGSRATASQVDTSFEFKTEYWLLGQGPRSAPSVTDSGCSADRAVCLANTTRNSEFCKYCSETASFNLTITVTKSRRYPVAGFGGYMIAFDGGDDFVSVAYNEMPQYEFGLQFWFQQNKIREGQSLFTWWSEKNGREWEVADTSNIFHYHYNNKTLRTGVGVNDGKWHHLAFSWRLQCRPEWRLPGMTYCVQDKLTNPVDPTSQRCNVDEHCTHVEISLFVDGVKRAESKLPAVLLSTQGHLVLGQSMQKPFKTTEIEIRDKYFQALRQTAINISSNLVLSFSDNQLQLIFSRLRSGYLNTSGLLEPSMNKRVREAIFCENEPWRQPFAKYCDMTSPGGFRWGAALSGNIDEFRIYRYYRSDWDVALGMNLAISSDGHFTFSPHEGNWSLGLYYNFDLDGRDFYATSKDKIRDWPLVIQDIAPWDGGYFDYPAELGGGIFQWAPLRVPSTAPIYGSRTVQIAIPDSSMPIPINLLDLQYDPDTPNSGIYTRVEKEANFGTLYSAADDCDTVETVDDTAQPPVVVSRVQGCRGSVLGFFLVSAAGDVVNCSGAVIMAEDPYGSGMKAEFTETNGNLVVRVISMGTGYDWSRSVHEDRENDPMKLYTNQSHCICKGNSTNIPGNLNPCFRPLVSEGKADGTGRGFAGFNLQEGVNGFPVNYEPTCSPLTAGGFSCPAIKPRPCMYACHREYGWMTDIANVPTLNQKFMVGPYSMYMDAGFPTAFWSNSKHIVWYWPEHLREKEYYKRVSNAFVLQDTIKDEFVVRFYDYLPPSEFIANSDPDNPPAFVHLWIQIVYEKLAIPLNTSVIWEESSPMLIQLHFVDFDRGTAILNSPLSVHVDPLREGTLYQAVRIERNGNEEEFFRDCVCPSKPRMPELNRTTEKMLYAQGTTLPSMRACNVSAIGQFCFKKGEMILQNDSFVTSVADTLVRQSYQHARDGLFVIYDMGVEKSGTSQMNWRIKYPQGQILNATVDIQVRSVNNRPAAINTSFITDEDNFAEVKLDAFDVDDIQQPAMYITKFPLHGTLYQCNATNSSSPCTLGERFSAVNESEPQWASVRVDPEGAIDDEMTVVMQISDPNSDDPSKQRMTRTNANTSVQLSHGYGFGSFDFDPDKLDNFRKLCNTRGTVAADLWLRAPVFVSDLDIFYPMRSDTPFRVLAERNRQFEHLSHRYSTKAGNSIDEFEATASRVLKEGYTYVQEEGIRFKDDGAWRSEQSFSHKRVDCGHTTDAYKQQGVCIQSWDGTSYIRGEERSTITEETERWFELFRGLPHQARAEYDRLSPVFAETLFQTKRLRIEACGAEMRVFGEKAPNFLEHAHRVRVWGSKTQRSKGAVTALDRRVVYVPDYNYNGADSFSFRVLDHAGGAIRSASPFSLQRHWSPVVDVDIQVQARVDKPLASNVVTSKVLGTAESEVLIPTAGVHPGSSGDESGKVTSFDIEITAAPVRGFILIDGRPDAGGLQNYSGILKYKPSSASGCGGGNGMPFDSFQYRIKNAVLGDDRFSRNFKVTIEVRCRAGYTCDLASNQCRACPKGTYGEDSAIANTCHLCPAGTFQGGTAAKSCSPCPPGSYGDRPGAEKCHACPEGTSNALEGQVFCEECPGGMFSPFPGLLECLKCGSKHWTVTTGAFTCNDCPNNTRTKQQASIGIESCECEYGYYNVHGKSGVDCHPCPPGAYCHGRSLLPVARTGYWTSQGIWTPDVEDMETGVVTLGEAFFAPCSFRYLRGVCIGYPDIDVQEQEERCQYRDNKVIQGPTFLDDFSSAGVNVNVTNCTLRDLSKPGEVAPEGLRSWIMTQPYAANSYCSKGYAGVICSLCAEGFYRGLTGYCFECPVFYRFSIVNVFFFLLIFLLNIGFWIVMFIAACHRSRSLYLTITHFQLVAMLGRLGVPWPDYVQGPILFSSLFNLALDGVHWNCLNIRPAFEVRWILEIFISACVVIGFYGYFHFRVSKALALLKAAEQEELNGGGDIPKLLQSASKAFPVKSTSSEDSKKVKAKAVEALEQDSEESSDDDDGNNLDQSNDGSQSDDSEGEKKDPSIQKEEALLAAAKASMARDIIQLPTAKEIRKLRDQGIWYTSMSLNVLFVMATSTILIPFSCSKVSDTLHYLDWYPEFSCGTPVHSNFQFLSYVIGVCWVIVFPGVMIYILRQGWYNELITDRIFIRQFGWFLETYEVKYFWWEVAALSRKAVVVGIANTITDNTYLQLLNLTVLLSVYLFWTFYCSPYVHDRHTMVDIWLQLQLLLVLTFALTNLVGNDGMKIITTTTGKINDNIRFPLHR